MAELSCKAKEKKIYVVVNLSEKEYCSRQSQQDANDDRPCAFDGFNFFNTDVVFDRQGTVIARYKSFQMIPKRWSHQPKVYDF